MKVTTKKYIFITYTILFTILCIVVFYPFYVNHLSLIWGLSGQDGISQHYAALTYYGEYIRNFFSNLIHGNFSLPMWDTSIGYGSDIISSLNYYAIGDPLNLVYAFANKSNAEYLYNFMIIFRAYLAGISFIIFGCYLKKNSHGIIIGSLIYVFSGFFLIYGIRHPFFLNPMIYLPLLIMAVEKIYRKEKPYLFTIMIAVSAMSNFYFFYMLTIAAVIYALIRFPVYKESGFFKTIGRFAGWYILGLGISMIILLPVLIGFSNNARSASTVNYFNIFLYQKAYYIGVIQQSIGYHTLTRATSLNYVALAYLAIIALFLKKSKERFAYKASIIVSIIIILFPIFGYVMHAFTYPTNRWNFVLALVVACTVTEVYEDLLNLTLLQKLGIAVGIIFYCLLYKLMSDGMLDIKLAIIVLILTALVLLLINIFPFLSKFNLKHFLMYGVVCFSICVSAFAHYSLKLSQVTVKYVTNGKAYKTLCEKETNILKKADIKNNKLDRIESINSNIPNWGLVDHIPNTTNYLSVTDKNVSNTLMDLGLTQYQYKFKFKKLDLRENLMNLYGVKYIITNKQSHKKIPSGYQLINENDRSKLYENKNILPFGYSYNSYITESEYQKLNAGQKEQAMLQSAVIDDNVSVSAKKTVYSDNTITKDVGTNYVFHKKKQKQKNVTIKIPKNYISAHCYLYLQDVRLTPYNTGRNHILYDGKNNSRFSVNIAGHKLTLYNPEAGSIYDTGKRSYLIDIDTSNIDRSKDATVTFTLKRPNEYTIGKISVVNINDKQQNANLNALKNAPHLTNISYDGANHFSGDITTKDNRILCIPISYNKGWKATDNGKPVKLLKVNGMLCGVSLNAGKHHIKLDYTTPGLKAGACTSLISLIILIGFILRNRKSHIYKKSNIQ